MKPAVEGYRYPVFIESTTGPRHLGLRIGRQDGRGKSQTTIVTLQEARLLAYSLLREVEIREVQMEKINKEAQETRRAIKDLPPAAAANHVRSESSVRPF
jgi:hypothetical protein